MGFDHERHVHPPRPGRRIPQIRHPQAVRRRRVNRRRTRSAGSRVAGSAIVVRIPRPRTAPRNPSSRINRSTVQRATEIPPRFSCNHTFRAPYTRNSRYGPAGSPGELAVPQFPRRRLPTCAFAIRGGGDPHTEPAQNGADRLEIPPRPTSLTTTTMLCDAADNHRCGRSSSAAKNPDADFKIALARFNSAFSRRNRVISSDSVVVTRGRCSASTCARRTHERTVSTLVTPSNSATAVIAAH